MEAATMDATSSAGGPACWCGCRDLHPYSPEYRACRRCGTLVSRVGLTGEEIPVRDDESDFYGKTYWLGHQTDELGLPDITRRARADVSERCMHWLWALLRFKQPPARILEVGCAHGGFVALARWAGFDATGLELSPWVVEFGRRTFGVPMLQGTVQEQGLAEKSFDAVVLNDVLEHLADPAATLDHCARLLKDDGVLLVQTPCYPEGASFEVLQARKDRFLEMMEGLARQHLYLFSRRAVGRLLGELGFAAVEFLPALFEYDMYLVAGKEAIPQADREALAGVLAGSPEGRMKLAWLDFLVEFEAREVDRAERLKQIFHLHDLLVQSRQACETLQAEVHRLAAHCPPGVAQAGGVSQRPGWLGSLRRLLRAG
jgi:2-polyprenyl-3-methyl-5-hydroxy-6-metoxy-1,4-benzoquinol methylase